jgi:hypothetical protein
MDSLPTKKAALSGSLILDEVAERTGLCRMRGTMPGSRAWRGGSQASLRSPGSIRT